MICCWQVYLYGREFPKDVTNTRWHKMWKHCVHLSVLELHIRALIQMWKMYCPVLNYIIPVHWDNVRGPKTFGQTRLDSLHSCHMTILHVMRGLFRKSHHLQHKLSPAGDLILKPHSALSLSLFHLFTLTSKQFSGLVKIFHCKDCNRVREKI